MSARSDAPSRGLRLVGGAELRERAGRLGELALRHRGLWPAAVIVLATAIAYQLTLASLYDYLRLETPLAYLPLLPFFSLGLALMTADRYKARPPMRDRQIDWLIGVPMLLVAIALITVVPVLSSTYYWTNRPDVLSLAMFVGSLVVLFYGVGWLWRIRTALIWLALMWPALYLHVMAGLLQSFTDATNTVLGRVVTKLPLGVTLIPQPNDSPLLMVHPSHGDAVSISIGSACSGADSVLGFLLIGAATLTALRGGWKRKLLWMIAGLAVTFAANLARITSIVALTSWGHSNFALGDYHATIGLILFALVVALMLRLLPLFGLHRKEPLAPKKGAVAPAAAPARPFDWRNPGRRKLIAAGAVGLLTIFVALADRGLAPYAAFEDGYGNPTVQPFGIASAPPGWRVTFDADYGWARQYFGANSTFRRYLVVDSHSHLTFADVVLTDDRGSLDAYSLQNCFLFHNYQIVTSQRVDAGNGVTALLLNYADSRAHTKWATVSWAWPVANKGTTYYERVTLTSSLTQSGDADLQPSGGVHDFLISLLNMVNGGHSDSSNDAVYKLPDQDLEATSHELVAQALRTSS